MITNYLVVATILHTPALTLKCRRWPTGRDSRSPSARQLLRLLLSAIWLRRLRPRRARSGHGPCWATAPFAGDPCPRRPAASATRGPDPPYGNPLILTGARGQGPATRPFRPGGAGDPPCIVGVSPAAGGRSFSVPVNGSWPQCPVPQRVCPCSARRVLRYVPAYRAAWGTGVASPGPCS